MSQRRSPQGLGTQRRHSPYAGPMAARTLVLASESPARLRLLRDAGFAPVVVVSGVDEDDVPHDGTPEVVTLLAERKAMAVADRTGDAVVIGCDSMLEFDGTPYGKPSSEAEALAWLRSMRGRTGTLYTGHCVIDESTGAQASDVAGTTVRFGQSTDAELEAYVATGEAMAVAGAFTLDGRSAPFVDGVDGNPGNVIGLSLPLFRTLLRRIGVPITALWV